MVIARKASGIVMRSCSPCMRPEAVTRFTAHQAVNRGPSGVTGASEWMAIGTPLSKAVRQAFILLARSGPTVRR